ncbi:MAG: glycoside hydrolase family 2 TIM barrel-domain containing protein [Luteolibacter sp.]|jgi:beta-galactosidase/beta-glucuronidase|nr:glycoside hydrolase family 2 TIM barrel-domain containing protein [Luteolibacter sp.]
MKRQLTLYILVLIARTAIFSASAEIPENWTQRPASPAVVNPPVRSALQEVISLKGKWEFATDPQAAGRDAGWMRAGVAWPNQRAIEVPGCWEAQGVGEPGTSHVWNIKHDSNSYPLRHIYMGSSWYRRSASIPADWQGKRIWLKIGGVRAQGWFWVNGHPVAHAENYCAVNKYDVTDLLTPGKEAAIVVLVRNDLPSRMGQVSSLHRWGGIYRDIEFEATPDTWIDNCRVEGAFDRKAATVHLAVRTVAKDRPQSLTAEIQLRTSEGKPVGKFTREIAFGEKNSVELAWEIPLADFRPWSPEAPNLYLAEVTLRDSDNALHGWTERFGVRKFEVRGDRFLLNDKPFFVRGYGDDYIYPLTLTSPASREEHRKHLKIARQSGFNYVRHHTHTEIPEYYDAADELGIMVQPELPYYGHELTDSFPFDPKRDLLELITHCRRYVSLATYSMGNEGSLGTPLDNELYQMVKQLDPARLAIHQDGGKGNNKDNSDFRPGPLRPWAPGSFACDAPYVAHEYLNLGLKSDPRLEPRFSGPYAPANDLATYEEFLKRVGLSRSWGDACMDAGHRLQQYYQKEGIENARLDSSCDGYCFWTLVDVLVKQRATRKIYAGQGLYNAFHEPKSGGATPDDFHRYNGPTALLMRANWKTATAGDTANVPLWISHFGDADLKGGALDWTLSADGKTLASGTLGQLNVATGDTRELGIAKITIPELSKPVHAVLEAKIKDSAVHNRWDVWLFPKRAAVDGKGMAASADLYPVLATRYPGIARAGTPEGDVAKVLVTSAGAAADIKAGRRIVLLELDDPNPNVKLEWWWIGDQAGTAIAKHPVFGDFPHSGFLSPLWFEIAKHSSVLQPDDIYRKSEPLMVGEGILGYSFYLSQARVGNARLLRADGLDLVGSKAPESLHLLDQILGYARSEAFVPRSTLDPTGVLSRWEKRQSLLADLSQMNGWSRTVKAEEKLGFPGQGNISTLKLQPGKNELEWETLPVSSEDKGETVTFHWKHGAQIGEWSRAADPRQTMVLHFNGKPLLKFGLDVSDLEWTVSDGGAALRYRGVAITKRSSTGLMSLTVPRSLLVDGRPNSIRLVGDTHTELSLWNGVIETNSAK